MARRESWCIDGADGEVIRGDTHAPARREARAVLVLAHGFKGYKDYGFFPQLAARAADAGVVAHRFNFSHSGMTEKLDTFERPDLFERDTWSRQVHDLRQVIRLRGEPAGLPVIVFGHSRGGVTALLTAAGADAPALAGLITAAAPDTACSLDEAQRAMLRKHGRLASPSSRTGQTLYVGADWLAEIEAEPAAFDPLRAMARVKCPMLVLHGDADETVHVSAAKRLAEAGRTRATVIAGANHVFNAPNPLAIEDEPPAQTRSLYEAAMAFVEKVSA